VADYNADRTVVAAGGNVCVAPVGTPKPATLYTEPAAPWINVGYISEDGATYAPTQETTDFDAWQKAGFRSKSAGQIYQWTFAMLEIVAENLKLAFGGGTSVVADGEVEYTPPEASEEYRRAVLIDAIDGDRSYRFWIPDAAPVELGEVTFNATNLATLPVTLQAQGSPGQPPFTLTTPDPDAAAVLATGATAGTPGSFTPPGSRVPEDLAELQAASIVAAPTTAWTVGQRVVLDDASTAHWDGDSYAAGNAP
jgi:hypothetical protein